MRNKSIVLALVVGASTLVSAVAGADEAVYESREAWDLDAMYGQTYNANVESAKALRATRTALVASNARFIGLKGIDDGSVFSSHETWDVAAMYGAARAARLPASKAEAPSFTFAPIPGGP